MADKTKNRWYQDEILRQSTALWGSGRLRQIVQLPTGGGKTRIATQLVDRAGFRRVLYVVPTAEIFEQTAEKFRGRRISFTNIEAGDYPDLSQSRVVLAMVQTLINRLTTPLFRDWSPDVIIVDEAHRRFGQIQKLLKRFEGAAAFGFSATPTRLDGKDLRELFPTMILGPSVSDLQAEGYLVPSRTIPDLIPDLSDLKLRRREFDAAEVERAYFNSGVLKHVPEFWLQHAKGRRTITFCAGVRSSEALVQAYVHRGVRALHIDGTSTDYERQQALDRLQSHDIDVLCNVGLFVEGLDLVETECITSLRPTQSVAFHLQSLGRGLRPSKHTGKKDLLILDHSGNTYRHGLVEDDRDWVRGGLSELGQTSVCRACGCAKTTIKCPHCGWEEQAQRVNRAWTVRREKARSLNTPPRPCPDWAKEELGLWLQAERQRAKQGLDLPCPLLGREGFTEAVVRRRLRGNTRG